MNSRDLERRLDRLEQRLATGQDEITVICIEYVPHGRLKGYTDHKGFYCARLPVETDEECHTRAVQLVRGHLSSAALEAHSAILLFADCEKATQTDWEEQAPAIVEYRPEL